MSWQALVAASVVLLSIGQLVQRVLLHKDKTDPIAFVIIFQGVTGILVLAYAALFGGLSLPNVGSLWPWMVACEFLFAFGNILYAKTLQVLQASVFVVVFATYSLWIMLNSILFFDESLSWLQGLGTVLIFASVGIVAAQGKGFKLKLDRGLLYGLAAGMVIGFAITLWVYVSRQTDPVTWTGVSFLAPGFILAAIYPKTIGTLKPLLRGDVFQKFVIMCALIGASQVFSIQSYNLGEAATIAPLQQTGIFTTTLLAVVFLHERDHLLGKFLAAVVCFTGVVLIV